jgi:cardiolipin synthase
MEAMFLDDLSHSTEIVLDKRRRPTAISTPRSRTIGGKGAGAVRAAAGVMRLSHALGAAITNRRELGPAEAVIMFWGAALLVTFSFVAAYWPRVVAFPAAILCVWIATSLVARALKLRRKRKH